VAKHRFWLLVVAAACVVPAAAEDWVVIEPPGTSELQPLRRSQLPKAAGQIERQLLQVDALVAADAFDEAVTALTTLLASDEARFVDLGDQGPVALRHAVHHRLASGPAAMLDIYRGRVDSIAESLYREAVDSNNHEPLRRIVRDYFCSTRGDDALLRLGEVALVGGDYDTARRAWLMLSPELTDAGGRAWGLVIDAERVANEPAMVDRFVAAKKVAPVLTYPQTDIDPATIWARLATTSIRAGQLDRAAAEMALLEHRYPGAVGRIAGRNQPLAAALAEMLAAAPSWLPRQLPIDYRHAMGDASGSTRVRDIGPLRGVAWDAFAAGPQMAPANSPLIMPVAANNRVVYHNGQALVAVDLRQGTPLVADSRELYREAESTRYVDPTGGLADPQMRALGGVPFGRRIIVNGRVFGGVPGGGANAARLPLAARTTLQGDLAFALLAPRAAAADDPTPKLANPARRLLGLDLQRQGLVAWEAKRPNENWAFSGPPLASDKGVVVPLRDTASGDLAVAAYSHQRDLPLWTTTLCQPPPAGEQLTPANDDMLRSAGDTLYLDSGDGFVFAIDRASGQIVWHASYPLGRSPLATKVGNRPRTMAGGMLVAEGLVLVAPIDAASVYAIDAATGQLVWQNDEAWDVDTLLGVVDGTLVATGKRLWLLDLRTGQSQWTWPESVGAGVAGCGRGCIAGDELFWPTRDKIYVFDLATRQQSRVPIELEPSLAGQGSVVVANRDHLIIATPLGLSVVGPTPAVGEPRELLQ
jgi:outer membrane protein assembly factor BamB